MIMKTAQGMFEGMKNLRLELCKNDDGLYLSLIPKVCRTEGLDGRFYDRILIKLGVFHDGMWKISSMYDHFYPSDLDH